MKLQVYALEQDLVDRLLVKYKMFAPGLNVIGYCHLDEYRFLDWVDVTWRKENSSLKLYYIQPTADLFEYKFMAYDVSLGPYQARLFSADSNLFKMDESIVLQMRLV